MSVKSLNVKEKLIEVEISAATSVVLHNLNCSALCALRREDPLIREQACIVQDA